MEVSSCWTSTPSSVFPCLRQVGQSHRQQGRLLTPVDILGEDFTPAQLMNGSDMPTQNKDRLEPNATFTWFHEEDPDQEIFYLQYLHLIGRFSSFPSTQLPLALHSHRVWTVVLHKRQVHMGHLKTEALGSMCINPLSSIQIGNQICLLRYHPCKTRISVCDAVSFWCTCSERLERNQVLYIW